MAGGIEAVLPDFTNTRQRVGRAVTQLIEAELRSLLKQYCSLQDPSSLASGLERLI